LCLFLECTEYAHAFFKLCDIDGAEYIRGARYLNVPNPGKGGDYQLPIIRPQSRLNVIQLKTGFATRCRRETLLQTFVSPAGRSF